MVPVVMGKGPQIEDESKLNRTFKSRISFRNHDDTKLPNYWIVEEVTKFFVV